MGHKIKPKVCEGCKVPKGWGEEIIIENNEMDRHRNSRG